MFELYWVDGWDARAQEPVGFFASLGAVDSPHEARELAQAWTVLAPRRWGPGQVVIVDAEATRRSGNNIILYQALEGIHSAA
ncbi:MAG: hypothetical protein JO247_15585 [Chloroflexi bacterium]|nr:hypothetical protein [Chloroflexota bacterium]